MKSEDEIFVDQVEQNQVHEGDEVHERHAGREGEIDEDKTHHGGVVVFHADFRPYIQVIELGLQLLVSDGLVIKSALVAIPLIHHDIDFSGNYLDEDRWHRAQREDEHGEHLRSPDGQKPKKSHVWLVCSKCTLKNKKNKNKKI